MILLFFDLIGNLLSMSKVVGLIGGLLGEVLQTMFSRCPPPREGSGKGKPIVCGEWNVY